MQEKREKLLLESQVRGEAAEVCVGEFGEGTEVIEGGESGLFAAKGIDGLGLLVTDIRMTLQTLDRAGVEGNTLYRCCIYDEMIQKGIEMTFGEGFLGQLLRAVETTQTLAILHYLYGGISPDAADVL